LVGLAPLAKAKFATGAAIAESAERVQNSITEAAMAAIAKEQPIVGKLAKTTIEGGAPINPRYMPAYVKAVEPLKLDIAKKAKMVESLKLVVPTYKVETNSSVDFYPWCQFAMDRRDHLMYFFIFLNITLTLYSVNWGTLFVCAAGWYAWFF